MPPMMRPADVVTASLAGLAHGEVVCIPGLDDVGVVERLCDIQRTVMTTANKTTIAERYKSSGS
jgi:hypothetical protein